MYSVTHRKHDEALRLCGLAKLGTIALSEQDISSLNLLATSYITGEGCPDGEYTHAILLIERHTETRATPEQVRAAPGTAAQKFLRMADATGECPDRGAAEAAGFTFLGSIEDHDNFLGPDGSRLAMKGGEMWAMPPDDGALLVLAGHLLFGERWQSALARALDIADRTVRRWARGDTSPAPGVWHEIAALAATRRKVLPGLCAVLKRRELSSSK